MGLSPLKGDFLADPLRHSMLKQEAKKHSVQQRRRLKGQHSTNQAARIEQAWKVFPCIHSSHFSSLL